MTASNLTMERRISANGVGGAAALAYETAASRHPRMNPIGQVATKPQANPSAVGDSLAMMRG